MNNNTNKHPPLTSISSSIRLCLSSQGSISSFPFWRILREYHVRFENLSFQTRSVVGTASDTNNIFLLCLNRFGRGRRQRAQPMNFYGSSFTVLFPWAMGLSGSCLAVWGYVPTLYLSSPPSWNYGDLIGWYVEGKTMTKTWSAGPRSCPIVPANNPGEQARILLP